MKLGRVDICLEVRNISESNNFYRHLDFKQVEGEVNEGWVVFKYFNLRLGLFQDIFEGVSINFRGGLIEEIVEELTKKGIKFTSKTFEEGDGSKGAKLHDPDNYYIYFNTHPEELMVSK